MCSTLPIARSSPCPIYIRILCSSFRHLLCNECEMYCIDTSVAVNAALFGMCLWSIHSIALTSNVSDPLITLVYLLLIMCTLPTLPPHHPPHMHRRLSQNPLVCNCSLLWLRTFQPALASVTSPTCSMPISLRGDHLLDLSATELSCGECVCVCVVCVGG